MNKYQNEQFLRSEHLLRNGKYAAPKMKIVDVLTHVPLQRKLKMVEGLALVFTGQCKVLGLGATNESLMTVIAGDGLPEKWIGLEIQLEVREVQSPGGGTEPAIRIIPAAGTTMRSGLIRQIGKAIKSA